MSDSLVNERTLEQPSNGQVERASGESQSGTDGEQTSNKGQSDENIRKLQSTYDKKLAEKDRQYQSQLHTANQQIQQMQQHLYKVQDEMAPDDWTRVQNQLARVTQERDAYVNAYNQSLQQQQQDNEKIAVLREIVDDPDFDLVTVDDLKETNGTIQAMKLAKQIQKQRERDKQQQNDDKRNRNAPDVGSSAPRSGMTAWERDYADAVKAKDTTAQMRLLRTRPRGQE